MKRILGTILALVFGAISITAGEVAMGGSNSVIGQGIEPPGLTFGLDRVAFDDNGEIDLREYALEGTLGDIEGFEFEVTDPHTVGWTWIRIEYQQGSDWTLLVSFVVDDRADDPFMTHAEWPDDDGYKDGWTAWGNGCHGMSVDRADTNGDGTPDGWEVYQIDDNKDRNLVHTYHWNSLPDATGPAKINLSKDSRIRFAVLGKWDSTEALESFVVRGGDTVPTVRFGPRQSPDGLLIRNVTATTDNAGEYVVTQYAVGVAMHPTRGYRTIASLPPYLDGAEGIKTSHTDRGVVGDLVSFTLIGAADVYICWDARCTEATWLRDEGWSLMPDTITLNEDPDAPNRQIWHKAFKAGQVTLPGPACDGRSNFFLMAIGRPQITAISYASALGQFTLTWESSTGGGAVYNVERTADLAGEWSTIAEGIPTQGDVTTYTDTAAPTGTTFYRVAAFPPPVLLETGFEPGEDLTGWVEVIVRGETQWEVGVPTTGPGSAHAGAQVLATKLGGNYGVNQEVGYRSPVIDLIGRRSATLEFFSYHEFEPLDQSGFLFDWGDVNILDADSGQNLLPNGAPALHFIEALGTWQPVSYALPAEVLGKRIRVEFKLYSDELNSLAGWYIDDVKLY